MTPQIFGQVAEQASNAERRLKRGTKNRINGRRVFSAGQRWGTKSMYVATSYTPGILNPAKIFWSISSSSEFNESQAGIQDFVCCSARARLYRCD
jgi:hypothetical protein